MSNKFKNENRYSKRFLESQRICAKYPDRLPVICQKASSAKKGCPEIDKSKYLIPCDLTMAQFIYVIRKRLKLQPEVALFMFVNGNIPSGSQLMTHIYENERDSDGFLYVFYSQENTFGNMK